jgi:hypothetical protein
MSGFAVIFRFKTKGGILNNTSIPKPARDRFGFSKPWLGDCLRYSGGVEGKRRREGRNRRRSKRRRRRRNESKREMKRESKKPSQFNLTVSFGFISILLTRSMLSMRVLRTTENGKSLNTVLERH